MTRTIDIGGRPVGPDHPAYVIAEMSANHLQDYDRAVDLVHAAHEAGADAIKLQTFRPDTLTLDSDKDPFVIRGDTPWDGERLYDLYDDAYMPWDWQPKLKAEADDLGIDLFSTADDESSVDFLEKMEVPAYKLASFELVDLPLIRKIAGTGKPLIMSTGMATLTEIEDAVTAARESGAEEIALLKCTSSYPAPAEDLNLRTIPNLAETFDVPAGLSDHTLDVVAPIAGITLGASIVEKHLTLSRDDGGPDAGFSLEPDEFARMVEAVRSTEAALGQVHYGPVEAEATSRDLRPSLWITDTVNPGDTLTRDNVDTLRPGDGLAPKHLDAIVGRSVHRTAEPGTPVTWDLIAPTEEP